MTDQANEPLQAVADRSQAQGSRRNDPTDFFGDGGLLVQTLARAIRQRVQLGRIIMHRNEDADDVLWYCEDGVWRPGATKRIEAISNELLDERLRSSYITNVKLALRASTDLPIIDDGPPHPHVIHFANGFLDWRTLGFNETKDPLWRSTVKLAVEWRPDATCSTYDAWVAQMLPADCDGHVDPTTGLWVPGFIDEVAGYLLLNGNPLHKAILLHGSGRNGKGTFLRIVTAVLGQDKCASVPLQALGENRFAAAELHMKLANVAGDLDSRRLEQTNMFKMITGEDMIYAERKNGQPFRYTAWAVPIFSANQVPTSSDTSAGYLSRWEVIPFSVDLTKVGIDPTIERRIRTDELSGVGRRAVLGLRQLMARGRFERPASIEAAFKKFEERIEPLRAWSEERCDRTDSQAWTYRTDLYNDFDAWATANSYRSMSAGKFYERLELMNLRERKHNNLRGFGGIRLKTPSQFTQPTIENVIHVAGGDLDDEYS